jgi:hypothetical protein
MTSPTFVLDLGATGTFVASSDAIHLQHRVPISNGPTVLAANGNVMRTTSVGQLPLSSFLSCAAQSAYVIDELQTGTLISLGQLCDDDVTAVFSKTAVNLLKNNQIIISGTRLTNGLWSIPWQPPRLPPLYIKLTVFFVSISRNKNWPFFTTSLSVVRSFRHS